MKREKLLFAAQKAILENALNPALPAVVGIWQKEKLLNFPIPFKEVSFRKNPITRRMQRVYTVDARQLLQLCESDQKLPEVYFSDPNYDLL